MTDRRSRWVPSSPEMWIDSAQTHLLYQDFAARVIPYRRDPEAYVLSTEGALSYEVDRALSLRDASEIEGFLRAVVTRLLRSHEAWLEVSFEDERREQTPFAVTEVDGVRRTAEASLVQQLPSSDELPEWHRDKGEWGVVIELDADRMVHVGLPDAYPSEVLTQVIRDLAEIEFNLTPPWVMEQWTGSQSDAPPYDAGEASRTQQLRLAQAALPIGWTARELYLGQHRAVSEYYHYLRELRFLHFLASLRSCAEDALRQVLTLAGDRCGFKASVTAFGVHTPDEVEVLVQKFEAGALPFSAVNDIIFEIGKDSQSQERSVL